MVYWHYDTIEHILNVLNSLRWYPLDFIESQQ